MKKSWLHNIKAAFGYKPETTASVKRDYQKPLSICTKLPWTEYDAATQTFPLSDGKSYAALFELGDIASEARPLAYLQQIQKGLQGLFQDTFPAYFDEESPWIIQFYCQDELSFQKFFHNCKQYAQDQAANSKFSRHYFKTLKKHYDFMTQPKGIFLDDKVSGNDFRGKFRKIRAVIYRNIHKKSKLHRGRNAIDDLNNVANAFTKKLEGTGVKVQRCTGKDFYEWMLRWFNPSPKKLDHSTDKLLLNCPYPGDKNMPFGYDFSERLFFSVPHSDAKNGIWYFDKKPHKLIAVSGLISPPMIGHLSVERAFGKSHYALFDKLPEHSIFVLTVVIQSQEQVKNHIFKIENSTQRGHSTEAVMAKEDCHRAQREIETNNYLYPVSMGVYIRADNLQELYHKETDIEADLSRTGLATVSGDYELAPIDLYLRYLPMCYNYDFDKKWLSRSRYLEPVPFFMDFAKIA